MVHGYVRRVIDMKLRYCVVILVLLFLFPTAASAQRTLPLVVDDADLLSDTAEGELIRRLEQITAERQCEVAVVTVRSLGSKTAQAFADDYYDRNGYGYGANDDGVLLLVAVTEREWAITTHGSARKALGRGALDGLEDRVTPFLTDGEYAEAFKTFAWGCESYLRYEADPSSADRDSIWLAYVDDEVSPGMLLLIAAAIGVVSSLLIVNGMKAKLTSVRSRDDANGYVRAGSFDVTKSRDIFLYHTVSRIRRDTNGSSGGHRSSSGRSHGGRSGGF